MNKLLLAIAFAGLVLNVSRLSAAEDDFRPVSSSEGDYSVELPAHPKMGSQDFGGGTKFHHFEVPQYKGANYVAGYFDLPEGVEKKDPQTVMKAFRSATREGAKITKDEEIAGLSQGGNKVPGIDYLCTKKDASDKELYLREQMFLMYRRFYRFSVLGTKEAVTGPDAKFFFESIQFSNSRKEREVKLDVAKLSKESQRALTEVAPGVKWEEATLSKGANTDAGKLVETRSIRVTGKDAKQHDVII